MVYLPKKAFLLLASFIFCWSTGFCQNYKWITGGGGVDAIGPSSGDAEHVQFMCMDANGNMYFTSPISETMITVDTFYKDHASNPGANYFLLCSYNCSGRLRWAKYFEARFDAKSDGIAYDNYGNIYCAGILLGYNKHIGYDTAIGTGNLTSFLCKFDTSGTFKWVRFVGPDISSTMLSTADLNDGSKIAIDGSGFIHLYPHIKSGVQLSPTVLSNTGTYDLKYDSTGNLISATALPLLDSNAGIFKAIFNRRTNTLYATEYDFVKGGGGVFAFNSVDSIIWFDTVSLGNLNDFDYKGGEYMYIASYYRPLIVKGDTISTSITNLWRIDTNGNNIKTVMRFNGTDNSAALAAVTLLPDGRIAMTGDMEKKLSFSNTDSIVPTAGQGTNPLFVIGDTAGNLLKLDQLHGDGKTYDWGTSITSDKLGNIYIGGQVEDSIWAGNLGAYHSNGGNTDFFIAKYGYSCSCTINAIPTPNFTLSGDSAHVPAIMNFTYTGTNAPDSVRWEFGDGSISTALNPSHIYTDTATMQVCLTVYGCDSGTYCNWVTTLRPTSVSNVKLFPSLSVYPNPVTDELNVNNISAGTIVQLYDLIGNAVYTTITTRDKLNIDTHNLRPGMYILMLTNKDGQKESIRIVKAE